METDYWPFYHRYIKKCEKLTDQELGRLVRALTQFSITGERQELAGRESIAFDFVADDIERAAESYKAKCRTNKANIEKRYQDQPENSTTVYDRIRPYTTGYEKDNINIKENKKENKTITPPVVPPEGGSAKLTAKKRNEMVNEILWDCSPELAAAIHDWVKYKAEKRQQYQETGFRSLLTQIRKAAAEHGESAVIEVIRDSMSSNYAGIMLDRLKNKSVHRESKTEQMVNAGRNNHKDPKTLNQLVDDLDKI